MREHRSFFLGTILAGLALRLLFFIYFPVITDDSHVYADLANNWLHHGVYGLIAANPPAGQQETTAKLATRIVPVDTRLPGYPAFLAGIFWLFGSDNFKAAMLVQILLDLGTCLIVADLARRMVSAGAARIALMLTALCPFLANYAAAALTETLEIFFTALALDFAAAALNRMYGADEGLKPAERTPQRNLNPTTIKLWAATGAAIAACILLRPDGGVLLAAIGLYMGVVMWKRRASRKNVADILVAGIVVAAVSLAPLAPWTIRNFRTLHHFQPLAPRYATESNELVPLGFIRWVKTWIADYASVEEIYWNVPGDKIDPEKLPSRAFDNPAEKEATLALIADYNQSQEMTAPLDARFGVIAAERIRAHPIRYYAALPLLRTVDMWLRPRTAILPPDVRWWEFNDDPKESVLAVSFGLLNLAYIGAALMGLIRKRAGIRWIGLLVCFLLLRSALLVTLENPEPRYTLECYPAVIVLAAACLATANGKQRPVRAGF